MDIMYGEGWEVEVEVGGNMTIVLLHSSLLPAPESIKLVFLLWN
jgi:hypothetical protein